MSRVVEVQAGGRTILVELAAESDGSLGAGDEIGDGVGVVSSPPALKLDGVRETIEAVAAELAQTWEKVRPDEATVEFSLKVVGKTGKLTGLLVEGGGEAALKVSLTWSSGDG